MRASQLATLRAIQSGAHTASDLVLRIGKSWHSRLAPLVRSGYVNETSDYSCESGATTYWLTAKARDLLARRAELDGET